VLLAIVLIAVLGIFVQARKLKQRYLQWGNRRVNVVLTWSNLSCVLKLDDKKELATGFPAFQTFFFF
jgi:hypothetical protein